MPKSDKDTIKLVNNLFELAKQGIAPLRRKWLQRYQYWKATEKIERPSYKDNVQIPLIFMIVDGIQSILTDNAPRVKFLPQEESDIETADALDQIIGDYYWNKLKLFQISEEIIWWALCISGSGLAKWGIDMATNEFYVKALNSFACYPDPGARSLDTLEFFIYVTPIELGKLKRIYGVKAKDITPRDELSVLNYDEDMILSPWARDSGKSENLIGILEDGKFKRSYGRALLLDCWVKSDEMEEVPVPKGEIEQEQELFRQGQNPEINLEQNHPIHIQAHKVFASNNIDNPDVPAEIIDNVLDHVQRHLEEPQEHKRLKYPHGKNIIVANDIVLSEGPAPFGLALAKMDCFIDPRDFWGGTMIEYLQSLQNSRVRRKRQFSDNLDLFGNQREFYRIGSGYDPDAVLNVPGEQIGLYNPQTDVYHPPIPAMPSTIMEDALDSERLLEKISGHNEPIQGIRPKGVTSGIAIQTLREAMGPRIRKISRHSEWCLEDIIRGIIRMLPHEDPYKIFSIMGEDYKPIYFNMDQLNLSGEYDIRIIAGSTLPTSRMEKVEYAKMMKEMNAYDEEAILKYVDDPQKNEVLERKSIILQQQQLIQMLQQQLQELQGQQYARTERIAPRSPAKAREERETPEEVYGGY